MAPRVFLDTSAVKLAATYVVRGFRRQAAVACGDEQIVTDVVQYRQVPKVPKAGTQLATDAALLPTIAKLAERRRIELLWHFEGLWEFAGLPNTDSPHGKFFGAPVTWVPGPASGGRTLVGGTKSPAEHQLDFLQSVRDPRFLELQTAVGVKDGSKNRLNQLLDAYHIWCAETVHATHFLTGDYKLIRHVRAHRRTEPRVRLVTARELVHDFVDERRLNVLSVAHATAVVVFDRVRRKPRGGLDELAELGHRLQARGFYD